METKSPSPLATNEVDKLENYLLGIFLVKSGSKGDSLLFRYPYTINKDEDNLELSKTIKKKSNNAFSLLANLGFNNSLNSNIQVSQLG